MITVASEPLAIPQLRSSEVLEKREVRAAAVVLGLVATSVFAIVCQWPGIRSHTLLVSVNTVGSVLCVAAATYIWREPSRRQLANVMLICGPLYSAQFVTSWDTGPWPLIGGACSAAFFFLGAFGILRYPSELKLDRWETPAIVGQLIVGVLAQTLVSLFTSREANQFSGNAWWHQIAPSWNHAATIHEALNAMGVVAEVLFVLAVAHRIVRAKPFDRLVLVPFGIATAVTGALSQTTGMYIYFPRLDSVFLAEGLMFCLVALSVVVILIWQDRTHARVAAFLSQEFAMSPANLENVRNALAKALSDDSLSILYWSPIDQAYFAEGRSVTDISSLNSKMYYTRALRTPAGDPLALIVGAPWLRRNEGIVSTALNASSVALENARLQANLLVQIEEVKQSRQRVAEAALTERRRIERDLHDGLQQRLLAVSTRLGVLTQQLNGTGFHERAESIGEDVVATNQVLRRLVRGIHPPELSQFGLEAALREILVALPLAATLDVNVKRLPIAVEGVAYFTVSEAVSNAIKHSGADQIDVSIAPLDVEEVLIQIVDNGHGGADANGHGLIGLRDRVVAFGGTLTVESDPGRTVISAIVPLDS